MTVYCYEGTPGSGKTLHATGEGLIAQRRPGGVVANYRITKPKVRADGSPRWLYVPESDMSPQFLRDHALRYHRLGKESEGLLIIDECHRILNSRTTWTGRSQVAKPQLELVRFLAEHRHFGFDVILIIQNLQMLDKHARFLIEFRQKHFKWNRFWWMAWCPIPIFGSVTYNAQFSQMKGQLGPLMLPWGLGKYDHQAMRAAVGGSFANARPSPPAAASALESRSVQGDPGAPGQEHHQMLGSGGFVPEVLPAVGPSGTVGVHQVPGRVDGAADLLLPERDGVSEDFDLVGGQ